MVGLGPWGGEGSGHGLTSGPGKASSRVVLDESLFFAHVFTAFRWCSGWGFLP